MKVRAFMTAKRKPDAILEVDKQMISPPDCFVTFVSTAAGWKPLHGTGCAHYVAHQLGIKRGMIGISACDKGFTIKVPELIDGMTTIEAMQVKVNDVWANSAKDHCGIVVKVEAAKVGGVPKITISQCSSNQSAGRLGVNEQDWSAFFGGRGAFFRPA